MTGFGLATGIIGLLELVTTGNYNSFADLHTIQITLLQHAYSLLCLYQSLQGNGSQQCPLRFVASLYNLGTDRIEKTMTDPTSCQRGRPTSVNQ
jgi:hypothetical protein